MRHARTRVKICGLTTPDDAAQAVAAGADAIGVVLADSPRRLTLEQASAVLASVPPMVARVGVFVDADPAFVAEAAARLGLHVAQFHGDETPEDCSACGLPVVKAVRVGQDFDPASVAPYAGRVAALLLDTYFRGARGGTGRTFAWDGMAALPDVAPVIVAGGLTPGNVATAVRALRPYAVDVSSGIEELPGVKDALKMRAFVAAVRDADEEAS